MHKARVPVVLLTSVPQVLEGVMATHVSLGVLLLLLLGPGGSRRCCCSCSCGGMSRSSQAPVVIALLSLWLLLLLLMALVVAPTTMVLLLLLTRDCWVHVGIIKIIDHEGVVIEGLQVHMNTIILLLGPVLCWRRVISCLVGSCWLM